MSETALEARGLTKSFGSSRAVDQVSFSLAKGEVLALVGENGAGKSTLLNLLTGLYRPDAGELRVRGKTVRLTGPSEAEAFGLGMVHQHFTLVPPLTVAENVVLGREPRRLGLFDRRRAEREVAAVAARHGLAVEPGARVESLSVASRQRVEILKILWRGAEILAFDEPTAALSPAESEGLVRAVRDFAAGGRAVLFVSHKLREVQAVADRILVLRAGRVVAEFRAEQADPAAVAAAMLGEPKAHDAKETPRSARGDVPVAAAAILGGLPAVIPSEARNLLRPALALADVHALDSRGAPALRGLTLSVAAGEVVGIAGVDGNGQREFAEIATGLRAPVSGTVAVAGNPAAGLSPASFRALGVAHVPEDRDKGGLCGALTLAENLALGRAGAPPYRRAGLLPLLDRAAGREHAEALLARFDVRPPDPDARANALSGGNQQKVVLARELDGAPKLVVAVHPTRGLDLHASSSVRAALREQAARGAGVLIVSFDLDELRELCDRLVVLCGGRATGEGKPAEISDARLSAWMAGAEAAA